MPKIERPREKLMVKGPENLKDAELLAILLRTGRKGKNVIELASQILSDHPKRHLLSLKYEELIKVKGIDSAKASALLAAFELSKRVLATDNPGLPVILTSKDTALQLNDLRKNRKEHFVVLYLNARNELLHRENVSVGTVNESLVHPREVFEPALKHLATQVVLAHNHPSGNSSPSPEDVKLTKRLVEAGKLLGIEVKDHVIIGSDGHTSIKEAGLL